MIFITVGTQLPFDRLVLAVDGWAAEHPTVEVFAQTGPTTRPPEHMPYAEFLSPKQVDDMIKRATLIIAHAGMGSILSALQFQKPIIILPRNAQLKEHRSNHQEATAKWLHGKPGVYVAFNEAEVLRLLDVRESLLPGAALPGVSKGSLVERLRKEILGPQKHA